MEQFKTLIIDDDDNFQLLLKYMLEEVDRSEYSIKFCSDYKSGLDAIHNEKWDVCLLDYRLDAGSGLDLLNTIKPEPLDFPIVLMTGQNGGDVDIQALDAGASDYLCKDDLNGELIDRCIRYAIKTKNSEKTLQNLALTDSLTGIANRERFTSALEEYKARSDRNNTKMAVIYIDVDHFKQINDSLGHYGGDEVLKHIANILMKSSRTTDLVARLGGDEFAIILDNITHSTDAVKIANKVIDECTKPLQINLKEITARVSIGIANYPVDTRDLNELLKAADTAMYEAKRTGRNGYRFFSKVLHEKAVQVAKIEQNFAGALEREEFNVFYQPKISSNNGICVGAEALIRWNQPESGFVSPELFIPIAEQIGLIEDIGAWVLEQVCLDTKNHINNHEFDYCKSIAVNVSTRQLTSDKNFFNTLEKILVNTGYPASNLEVEITETALAHDQSIVMKQLAAIHNLGVKISIDDFGTGYSSLSNLVELPIDCLKVDRSFVSECIKSAPHRKIVESVSSLAKSLGMTIVAEGIEDIETADFLRELGCDLMQGYYFSKPIPKHDFFNNFYKPENEVVDLKKYG